MQLSIVLRFLACMLLLSVLGGCVPSGPTGRWRQSMEAQQLFESATLLSDHTYYYIGSRAHPDAIIAINNKYVLQTTVWAEIAVDQRVLNDWMAWYRSDISLYCPHRGGYIFTPDQQIAGIWYSKDQISTVRSPQPGVLEVYPPYSAPGSMCDRERIMDDL